MSARVQVRQVQDRDREAVRAFVIQHWGAEQCIAHGRIYIPHTLPGFLVEYGDEMAGLLTYSIEDGACEIITLNNVSQVRGVGTALIEAIRKEAKAMGCTKLWLMTNNDNLDAIRFYQKRSFRLAAIHRDAVTAARKLKPQIPLIGNHGIPILDEVEMEMRL